jgi:hypothetical protein
MNNINAELRATALDRIEERRRTRFTILVIALAAAVGLSYYYAGIVIIPTLLVAYFIPALVAGYRGHHQTLAIVVLNLLLGWTVLGWIGALVWACTAVRGRR